MVPILLNLNFLLESRHMGSDRDCSRQANRKLLRDRIPLWEVRTSRLLGGQALCSASKATLLINAGRQGLSNFRSSSLAPALHGEEGDPRNFRAAFPR